MILYKWIKSDVMTRFFFFLCNYAIMQLYLDSDPRLRRDIIVARASRRLCPPAWFFLRLWWLVHSFEPLLSICCLVERLCFAFALLCIRVGAERLRARRLPTPLARLTLQLQYFPLTTVTRHTRQLQLRGKEEGGELHYS